MKQFLPWVGNQVVEIATATSLKLSVVPPSFQPSYQNPYPFYQGAQPLILRTLISFKVDVVEVMVERGRGVVVGRGRGICFGWLTIDRVDLVTHVDISIQLTRRSRSSQKRHRHSSPQPTAPQTQSRDQLSKHVNSGTVGKQHCERIAEGEVEGQTQLWGMPSGSSLQNNRNAQPHAQTAPYPSPDTPETHAVHDDINAVNMIITHVTCHKMHARNFHHHQNA